MKKVNRRDFIRGSAGLVGLGAAAAMAQSSCPQTGAVCPLTGEKRWTGFKYAMCNESMMDKSWYEQCKTISDAGFQGVEIAAFTLVDKGVQELSTRDRREMVKVMRDTGLECAGLHWLLAPPPKGLHFTTPDVMTRMKTVEYLHELIDFCGDLGGTAMIFGSPKQRNTIGIAEEEAMQFFAEGMAKVADHAQDRGVKILLEPLDHTQTDVMNTTQEAMRIVRQVNHPAIQTMFDFHNTVDETEDFVTILKKYRPYIHHVHVMEMDGKHLGTGNAVNEFVDAFQYLKEIQFDKWVSLEVFDFTPGGQTIANESMKTLRQIESKLA